MTLSPAHKTSYPLGQQDFAAATDPLVIEVSRIAAVIAHCAVKPAATGHNAAFEGSLDSTDGTDGTWFAVSATRTVGAIVETSTGALAATPGYAWRVTTNGLVWLRIRATAHTSGTMRWSLQAASLGTEANPVIQFPATQPISYTQQALPAGTSRVGFEASSGIWWDDSSSVLAAAATFTGTSRDLTVTATATNWANAATYAKEFRVSAESDQAGTLWVEISRDGTNWRRAKAVATAAVTGGGQYAEIVFRPSWRYARVGFTNGASLQTRFTIGSIAMAS